MSDENRFTEENSKNSNRKKGRIILKNLTKEQRQNVLSVGSGALIGAAGQAGIISLMSFASASETQAAEPDSEVVEDVENAVEPVVVYTEAPFADSVTDEMSFSEAFASAREEVGAGGIFEWKGNSYNTYTKEEFDRMTDEEQGDYVDSIEGQVISVEESAEAEINNDFNVIEGQTLDLDGDGINDAVFVSADGDEQLDLMVDSDGDGDIDVIVYDASEDDVDELKDEMGNDEELVLDEEDYEDTDFDDDTTIAYDSSDDIDTDDFTGLDASYDIDNDVDMSDFA